MQSSRCASLTKEVFNDTNTYDKCYDFFWYVCMCRNAMILHLNLITLVWICVEGFW